MNNYPDRMNFEEHAPRNNWVGRSSIFGPKGVVLAEADAFRDQAPCVIGWTSTARHIGSPDVQFSLYKHVYEQYRERYDPNLWLQYLPPNKKEAAEFLKDKARWQAYWYDF